MSHVSISQPITGQKDKVFEPTWVSCSPWAVEGYGSQDLWVPRSEPSQARSLFYTSPSVHTCPMTCVLSTHPGPWVFTALQHRNPISLTAGSPVPTW